MVKSNQFLTSVFMTFMFLTLVLSVIYFSGCSSEQNNSTSAQSNVTSQELNTSNPTVQAVIAVQNKYSDYLMGLPNVVGVGVGLNENNVLAIMVFTSYPDNSKTVPQIQAAMGIPKVLDNIPVVINNTGAFHANSVFTQKYTNNIPIGVSIIDPNEGCAAGTLGCMVKDNSGKKYMLSCNHVLANENQGTIGWIAVLQPGTYDSETNSMHCF